MFIKKSDAMQAIEETSRSNFSSKWLYERNSYGISAENSNVVGKSIKNYMANFISKIVLPYTHTIQLPLWT